MKGRKIKLLTGTAIFSAVAIALASCKGTMNVVTPTATTTPTTSVVTTATPSTTATPTTSSPTTTTTPTTSSPTTTTTPTTSSPTTTTTPTTSSPTTTTTPTTDTPTTPVEKYTISFDAGTGVTVAPVTVDAGGKLVKPTDPIRDGYTFGGWYTDQDLTTPYDFDFVVNDSFTLYAKWVASTYENVTYELADDVFINGKATEDMVFGNFTIKAGADMRDRAKKFTDPDTGEQMSFARSLKLGNPANLIITAPGDGKLSIIIQNGSSGAATQKIFFGKSGETPVEYEFDGTNTGSPLVKLTFDVEAGYTYELGRPSGTVDLYYATMTCSVEKSDVSGFEIVNEGIVDYLPGTAYDSSKLVINAIYENGREEQISLTDPDLKIDTTNFNANTPGVYEIIVQYKTFEEQVVTAVVYDLVEITLGYNKTVQGGSTQAGNGTYINHTVQSVYALNSVFSTDGLTIGIVGIHPTNPDLTYKFTVDETSCTISGFDSNTAGLKTIAVKYGQLGKTFDVYVVDTAPSIVNGEVQLQVNQAYTGEIGAVVDGYNTFTSIAQALEYIKSRTDITSDMRKVINVKAGLYNEKLEIDIPYLTIVGEDKETTIIEWDSLYGIADEGGFVQVTDSTQTVAVRDTAVGCIIENITISNYWNSLEAFDQEFGPGYSEHRALALLVQADQFKMINCKLLGYQDTLELFTGRQLFENTYISGTTDFIFGSNNTTYFKNCEIHSINSEANRGTKTDGGYITAFKGNNKGATDYVEYGAIFDGCNFTADADVLADGNTAIGRTWGAYAAVMIMNSTLGAHISKTENTSGTAAKNVRYVSMNGTNVATTTTLKFFEYNNTGEGAITESQTGVTVLTDASVAAKYADYSVIFGKTNGMLTYTAEWDPTNDEIVVDPNIYYVFDGKTNSTGTNYVYNQLIEKTTGTLGGMTIDATNGKLSARASDTQMNAGTKLSLVVEAGDTVKIDTYAANNLSINGITMTKETFSVYFTAQTTVEIVAINQEYLHAITVIKGANQADADATYDPEVAAKTVATPELTADGNVVSWVAVENAASYQVYVDGVAVGEPQTATSYDLSAMTPGSYKVSVKAIAVDGYLDSNVSDEVSIEIFEAGVDHDLVAVTTGYNFKGGTYSGDMVVGNVIDCNNTTEGSYMVSTTDPTRIENITITGAKSNGVTNWLAFNTGATITFKVSGPCTINICFYNGNENVEVKCGDTVVETTTAATSSQDTKYAFEITEAGSITITATANGYIGYFEVVYPEA